ncbi:MAG TPA: SRPBCC family protein [Dehalococcoidia bacterium]|nr:SRPBCC family protein [Dehalococcoidia bacterium]
MKVQKSIEIAAPPEKVWPFLVEPKKILKWCITFKKFEYTGKQRSGVGTALYVEEKAGGPLMKLNFAVTEWVENKKLAFNMTSGNFVKGYEQTWTVDATPPGSRFTFMEQVKLPYGVIGKVMELFARRSSEATVREMLAKLKSLVET